MPIKFRCPSCKKRLSITTRKAGKAVVCPACNTKIKVPELDPPAEEPVAKKPAETNPVEKPIVPPPVETKAETKTETEKPTAKPLSEQQLDQQQQPEQQQPALKQETELEQEQEQDNSYPEPARENPPLQFANHGEAEVDQDYEFEMRRASSDFEELDMTPMVDVTFLLLIFFMVTASFSIQKALEVPPPDPDQQGAAQTVQPLEELEETSILIEIDADNRIMVESEPVNDVRDLSTVLAEVRARESKNEVIVKVDEQTHHEAVVAAIDAAQEVGMQRIRWGISPD